MARLLREETVAAIMVSSSELTWGEKDRDIYMTVFYFKEPNFLSFVFFSRSVELSERKLLVKVLF